MYIFLENNVLVLWVAFKRFWQLEVNHKRDNKKASHVEAVYCIRYICHKFELFPLSAIAGSMA